MPVLRGFTGLTWTSGRGRRAGAAAILLAAAAFLPAQGCATTPAPGPGAADLLIEPGRYREAFDAAAAACAEAGLHPSFRDHRGGAIWTAPLEAPTLLEPWRRTSSGAALQNTLNHERRYAVVQFRPADAANAEAPAPGQRADILAMAGSAPDLTEHRGQIEMQIRVYLERQQRVGLRRDAWTRRQTSLATIIDPDSGEPLPASQWVAVGRDPAEEHRLADAVRRALSGSVAAP